MHPPKEMNISGSSPSPRNPRQQLPCPCQKSAPLTSTAAFPNRKTKMRRSSARRRRKTTRQAKSTVV
ncbi:hypothetical protein A2U01_0099149, partial [Trifolium medium]|nr:hypothetical protein [Trifolium medium]